MKKPIKPVTPAKAVSPEEQVVIRHNLLDACHELMLVTGATSMNVSAHFIDGSSIQVSTSAPTYDVGEN